MSKYMEEVQELLLQIDNTRRVVVRSREDMQSLESWTSRQPLKLGRAKFCPIFGH